MVDAFNRKAIVIQGCIRIASEKDLESLNGFGVIGIQASGLTIFSMDKVYFFINLEDSFSLVNL